MDGLLLATPDYVVRARAAAVEFDDVTAAAQALRSGRAELVCGALPFRPDGRAALSAPARVEFRAGPLDTSAAAALPTVRLERQIPTPAEHRARVAALVDQLSGTELRKVVAARSVVVRADAPIDPPTLVAHLVARHRTANGFAVDLSPAGRAGVTLVGCSPELLVSVRGDAVSLRPLAGTAARSADPMLDEQQAEKLLASEKNREEHAYVIDWIRERLLPVCAQLDIPDGPELIGTPDVWHLATPIAGRLRDPDVTALDLAVLLHPTPAVGGSPVAAALAAIATREEDRGFYGGAVGWCDARGDGDWIVAIRCAEVAADGRTARAYAGGGIVIGSDPQGELDETTMKLRTFLSPLGLRV
jgi:isochorismate synthase